MTDPLREARKYLRTRYATLNSKPDWDFSERVADPTAKVQWIWQTSDLKHANTEESATGAAITDAQIGVCLYLLQYQPEIGVRPQLARALNIRSRLLPTRSTSTSTADPFGTWRIVVHWMIERDHFPAWIENVAELRQQTAHFEEVPIDAIVKTDDDWAHAIAEHGFPRLLFELRSAMQKRTAEDMDRWQSADEIVLDQLSNLSSIYTEQLVRECADGVVKLANDAFSDVVRTRPARSVAPTSIQRIALKNFRNIQQLDLKVRNQGELVSATIVQGPNGSGKSSVFEALSFAVAGTSARYVSYLREASAKGMDPAAEYGANYLTNFNNADTKPQLALNGSELSQIDLVSFDEADTRLKMTTGTLLSQESSQSLIAMSATELGSEIASSFSIVAERVKDYIEVSLKEATQKQRDFNEKWGLRGNVTQRKTAVEKIVTSELTKLLPSLQALKGWLRTEVFQSTALGQQFSNLADSWESWDNARAVLLRSISSDPTTVAIGAHVREYLSKFEELRLRTASQFHSMVYKISEWPTDLESQIEMWGEVTARAEVSTAAHEQSDEIRKLRANESRLATDLQLTTQVGQVLADQLRHLENLQPLLSTWVKHFPNSCPTCESDLSARGGISSATKAVGEGANARIADARARYQEIRAQMMAVSNQLTQLGIASQRLSPSDISALQAQISWIVNGDNMEFEVSQTQSRENLVEAIRNLRRGLPTVPVIHDQDALILELTKGIEEALAEFDQVAPLPAAWRTVQSSVNNALAVITAQHLPKTLQALWLEIARNITPAPWQYPGRISFQVTSRRMSAEARIVVGADNRSVLANYILNGAEVHSLGVAWFLCRYVTFGRFRFELLVLDDPAQTMDQPTYRDLCRLLETLLRMHKVLGIPLGMVLLLHQDERALDAARATDGVLHLLRWNKMTPTLTTRLKLRGEQMVSPMPGLEEVA